mgnify:CR=1 FL=1
MEKIERFYQLSRKNVKVVVIFETLILQYNYVIFDKMR